MTVSNCCCCHMVLGAAGPVTGPPKEDGPPREDVRGPRDGVVANALGAEGAGMSRPCCAAVTVVGRGATLPRSCVMMVGR